MDSDDIAFYFLLLSIFSLLAMGCFFYIRTFVPSGIHHVRMERQCLQMAPSYNPFSFEVDYSLANYSGIKCILKSEQPCYIQAFWGVPIFSLFELLHKDWQSLINAVSNIDDVPEGKFSTKCICANDPFILPAGEEKCIEFKPQWDIKGTVSQEGVCMRKVYPLVVLMVLKEKDELGESFVVAMASAIHVPDNNMLLGSQILGQYIKLASGYVGEKKKIFLSAAVTSDPDGEDGHDLCIICYARPVSEVFLPCCHACLCSVCFKRCMKCPICRSTSLYYLELPDVHGENHY